MIGPTIRALPMRIGIGAGRLAQGIPLSKPTGFGITSLLLFYLGDKHIETTLVDPGSPRGLRLGARLRGQPRVKSCPRQKHPAFRMRCIALDQKLG